MNFVDLEFIWYSVDINLIQIKILTYLLYNTSATFGATGTNWYVHGYKNNRFLININFGGHQQTSN